MSRHLVAFEMTTFTFSWMHMEPEESLGFQIGGPIITREIAVPVKRTLSGNSTGFNSSYATRKGNQSMSSTPRYTESPSSFHTADQLDNDYQQDVNSEVLESPSSTPPARTQFYSDGRPRPIHRDGDDESRDSFEDGGYTTATQIPAAAHFVDPDQPKLLLAEEAVQPLSEKRPLPDEFVQPATHTMPPSHIGEEEHDYHEEGAEEGARRRSRPRHRTNENTPLLPQQNSDTDQEKQGCCSIL